ncbi:hypothetical protein HDU78_007328 [Chytriomyces hyalinus]|nr:hypothetical protein HDU78_007328 [Chytriomyces hyalinus]
MVAMTIHFLTFGSDSGNDAVWDRALDDCESVQVQSSDEKEELVDYVAMMDKDMASNNSTASSESSVRRENTEWEVGWNITEEVILGDIAIKEMDLYDPEVKVYLWEYKPE